MHRHVVKRLLSVAVRVVYDFSCHVLARIDRRHVQIVLLHAKRHMPQLPEEVPGRWTTIASDTIKVVCDLEQKSLALACIREISLPHESPVTLDVLYD